MYINLVPVSVSDTCAMSSDLNRLAIVLNYFVVGECRVVVVVFVVVVVAAGIVGGVVDMAVSKVCCVVVALSWRWRWGLLIKVAPILESRNKFGANPSPWQSRVTCCLFHDMRHSVCMNDEPKI